ncbi:MAG: DUF5678 domain-containing protein [Alphaproteobacteria bacterium]|jgi:hypothetical protein|nr:DUF5678 domain-containing protein [Alphaproteobacteria bacterium]|tara:strand:+ start:575 stop:865 length:291 start_codon:yes stop_codon:yes gene_type:complete
MAITAEQKDALSNAAAQADEIKASLVAYSQSARVLSNDRPRMIEKYPDQWVAVSGGAVLAHGDSLELVLEEVDNLDIDRAEIIVRLIERNLRTFVL